MKRSRASNITLRGLVAARWVTLSLLSAAAVPVGLAPHALVSYLGAAPSTPTAVRFAGVLVVWGIFNVWIARRAADHQTPTTRLAGSSLLVDVFALTALMSLTGGAANPFTTLYFVPITLATLVSPRWTWAVAATALAGFALLFVLEPLPSGPPGHEHHFAGHLRGMWVAFGASGMLVTIFVHRIALRLRHQRDELLALREAQLEDRHLASLGSLAAGAAHELATPLGTIGLLAAEVEHMDPEERAEAASQMHREVDRCKRILERMASPDARVHQLAADAPAWPLPQALREAEIDDHPSVRISTSEAAKRASSTQPLAAIAQIVRELVSNAVEACERRSPQARVAISLDASASFAEISVYDDGVGMGPELEARATDPFFSTKPGGMGLGLYLARAQARQLGGSLEVSSRLGHGTHVRFRIPLERPEGADDHP